MSRPPLGEQRREGAWIKIRAHSCSGGSGRGRGRRSIRSSPRSGSDSLRSFDCAWDRICDATRCTICTPIPGDDRPLSGAPGGGEHALGALDPPGRQDGARRANGRRSGAARIKPVRQGRGALPNLATTWQPLADPRRQAVSASSRAWSRSPLRMKAPPRSRNAWAFVGSRPRKSFQEATISSHRPSRARSASSCWYVSFRQACSRYDTGQARGRSADRYGRGCSAEVVGGAETFGRGIRMSSGGRVRGYGAGGCDWAWSPPAKRSRVSR